MILTMEQAVSGEDKQPYDLKLGLISGRQLWVWPNVSS